MVWIGMMVKAEPMPKPATVIPAASPRRSGNHFSAVAYAGAIDAAGPDAADR
jgi:hypothetical protein